MNRRNVVRLALAAALFGATMPGAALAQDQGKWWTPRSVDAQQSYRWNPPQDQQGDRWNPPNDEQQFPSDDRGLFEGRWVAQDRFDADDRGAWSGGYGQGWNRGMALPNALEIEPEHGMLEVEDWQDHPLQMIAIGDTDDDDAPRLDRRRVTFLDGDLRGDRLIATGTDARGRRMRQVMILGDDGNTLVVRTRVARAGFFGLFGRTVQVEKVYQRA